MTDDEVEMEIFRSGSYGAKGTYSDADLQQIADDYRATLLEAPLTFDHAQAGPAYGWVARIRREGDRLVAALKGVPEAVRQLVRSGAYKRRSVELIRQFQPTGRPYLRAVSLLGAATPEVKGLRDICFAAETETCAVDFAQATPAAENDAPEHDATANNLANQTGQIRELENRLRESQLTALFSELRADGYCLAPGDAKAIKQLFGAAASADTTVAFSDGSTITGLDWLGAFLRQGLMKVPSQTPAVAGHTHGHNHPVATFSERTDPRSLQLHHRATALCEDTPGLSYRDALAMASRLPNT